MLDLDATDPPAAAHSTPLPASTHTAVLAQADAAGNAGAPPRPRPSRLLPLLAYGVLSTTLFAVSGVLRNDPVPLMAELSDYACLGACLSGVAAAIFGCVTLARAIRRRRR